MHKKNKKEKNIQKGTKDKYKLLPNLGIGDLKLGNDIKTYEDYLFNKTVQKDVTEWDLHEFPDETLEVYTNRNGTIESICCRYFCFFKEKNLIGMTFSKAMDLLDNPTISEIDKVFMYDDSIQEVYDIDDLGLQLWVHENELKTIFLS